ncbi:MAG: DUF3137 domain-containing protein [Hyphomonadaceae bacterium]|nr:DUF3137 domain-containing protein [Hyphomonadaceae bacterium]
MREFALAMQTIDLAHLTDAQFNALYAGRLEPLLVAGDQDRVKAVKTFRQRLAIGLPVVGAVLIGLWQVAEHPIVAVFVACMALAVAYTIAYLPLQRVGAQMKGVTLAAIAEAVGVSYAGAGAAPEAMPRYRGLNLVPSYDRCRFEDFFHGERLGRRFSLCEAVLEEERRDKDGKRSHVTVFRGQLIRIAFPKAFLGVTIVRRDAGVFNALRGMGALKRVGLGDTRFERAFEVYSDDQVEARYLVHLVFMERLLDLEAHYKGKNLRCAFEQGDLLLAVEAPDRFEIGDLFKPLADPGRARRIVDDLADVMKLMDAVLTAEIAPLLGRP